MLAPELAISRLPARGPAVAPRVPGAPAGARPSALAGRGRRAAARGPPVARRRPRAQQRAAPARRRDRRALRQARAAELRRLRRGAHVRARPRHARLRPRRRALRGHDLRGRLARRTAPARRPRRGGATVVLNISSSPYHVGKGDSREEMLRTRARDGLCVVAYCNLVGGQDELRLRRPQRRHRPRRRGARARRRRSPRSCWSATSTRRPRWRRGCATRGCAAGAGTAASSRTLQIAHRQRAPAARAAHRGAAARPDEDELWGALVLGAARLRAQERLPARRAGPLGRHRLGARGGAGGRVARAAERVEAVSMPTRYNVAETRSDAPTVAEALGIGFRELADRGAAARRSSEALPEAERPGGREPAGAHPRHGADDALATSTAGSC